MYIIYGNGVAWDKAANKPLCTFQDGRYVTGSKARYDKLVKLGYQGQAPKKPPAKDGKNGNKGTDNT